jgi:hypothetical protein
MHVQEGREKLNIEEKRLWFYNQVEKVKQEVIRESILIIIDRNNFFRDSFEQFKTTSDLDLRKVCFQDLMIY